MTAVGPRGEEWGRLIVPRAAADTARAQRWCSNAPRRRWRWTG